EIKTINGKEKRVIKLLQAEIKQLKKQVNGKEKEKYKPYL
ncbi:4537_t:CDS:1, partial [Scutellospora calospora]